MTPATESLKIVFIHPAYAHYRRELFDRLHRDYDVTFIFLQGRNWLSHQSPKPEWKCTTLNKEHTRWWVVDLVRSLLRHRPAAIITSVNGSLQTLLSILVGKFRRIPVVLWSESWGSSERWLVSPWWKKWYGQRRAKWATARVDAVVVSGTRCLEYHRGLGVAEDRIFLSPQSTIDHRSVAGLNEAAPASRAGEHPVHLLYFSRILKLKGLDILLQAFAGLVSQRREAHLLIVGDGPFRKYCEQLRDDWHIPNVRFVGWVPNEEAWKYYQQADIFVLPCSGKGRREGWGLVVNEALSMSLPVVTTEAVGCVPDLVQEGRNGYVVAPGDVAALRQALQKLVEDRSLREQMGAESRAIFEEFNSYEKQYRGFDAAIRFALTHRGTREGF
ncbi:MAG: glycosyltransferase family 4 protein [Planctomycetes bacterium]|nr:glycosyltransferase family 4 protein [Planctomycetota bacterium]